MTARSVLTRPFSHGALVAMAISIAPWSSTHAAGDVSQTIARSRPLTHPHAFETGATIATETIAALPNRYGRVLWADADGVVVSLVFSGGMADTPDTGPVIARLDRAGAMVAEIPATFLDDVGATASRPYVVQALDGSRCVVQTIDPLTLALGDEIAVAEPGALPCPTATADEVAGDVVWTWSSRTVAKVDVATSTATPVALDGAIPEGYEIARVAPIDGVLYLSLRAGYGPDGLPVTAADGSELPPLVVRTDSSTGAVATMPSPSTAALFGIGSRLVTTDAAGTLVSLDLVTLAPTAIDAPVTFGELAGLRDAGSLMWSDPWVPSALDVVTFDPATLSRTSSTRISPPAGHEISDVTGRFDGSGVVLALHAVVFVDGSQASSQLLILRVPTGGPDAATSTPADSAAAESATNGSAAAITPIPLGDGESAVGILRLDPGPAGTPCLSLEFSDGRAAIAFPFGSVMSESDGAIDAVAIDGGFVTVGSPAAVVVHRRFDDDTELADTLAAEIGTGPCGLPVLLTIESIGPA